MIRASLPKLYYTVLRIISVIFYLIAANIFIHNARTIFIALHCFFTVYISWPFAS